MSVRGNADLDGGRTLLAVKRIEVRGDTVVAIDRSGDEHILCVGA